MFTIFSKKQSETDKKEVEMKPSIPLSTDFDARLLRLELQFEELRKLLLQGSASNPQTPVLSYRGKRLKNYLKNG